MKAVRAVGAFVVATSVFTLVLWLAWAGAWLSLDSGWPVFAMVPSAVIATILCAGYWLMTRKRSRTLRSLGWTAAVGGVCLYGALYGLHFLRMPPTRFRFIPETAQALVTDPGLPGLVQMTYTFPGNSHHVIREAVKELSAKGYQLNEQRGTLAALLQIDDGDFPSGIGVGVSSGKVTGKRWVIDGDMVNVEKRDDWVTVDVTEPDVVPLWLREWAP